jgi:hypothetical protein
MSIYFQEKIVKIIHNHPDAQVRFSFLFARVASKQEDWQSSVEWMQKFGDVTGHDGGVYLLIARSLYNNNQSKKAIPYMGIALQKEKRNSQTWYELLDLLAAAKEWELLAQALPITEYWLGVEFDHEYLKGLKSWKGFFESQAYKEMLAGGVKK